MNSVTIRHFAWRWALLLTLLPAATVSACEISVRDAAFRVPRDIHRIVVMSIPNDPETEAITKRLQEWIEGPGQHLNLELISVDVDDPDVVWSEYGVPSAPPMVPVVALIGRNNGTAESFVIDHWQPGPDETDLETLLTSPVRQRLSEELGNRLGVILYSPQDESTAEALEATVSRTAMEWAKRSTLGVATIRLDRTDPHERTLLAFAGIRPQTPDWVSVVFGRGKVMSPPLVGELSSTAELNRLLEQLDLDCNCSKPLPSLGVDIPFSWDPALEGTVVALSEETEVVEEPVPIQSAVVVPATIDAPPEDVKDAATSAIANSSHTSTTTFSIKTSLIILAVLGLIVIIASTYFLRG